MAITSENLKNAGAAIPVDPADPFPGVKAKPLGTPDFINLKPKNPLISFRWGNRTAGEGMRLEQLIAAGFRYAKPDEVFLPTEKGAAACPNSLLRDGKIQYGDLVLLAISKAEYDGALKYNWERAVQRMHPRAAQRTGQETLEKTLKEAGVRSTPGLTQKLKTFQPTDAEIEAGEKAST